MVFWGINRSGYVTDISKAGLYEENEAKQICTNRKTDIAWPENYIKSKIIQVVDMQYVDKNKARWKK